MPKLNLLGEKYGKLTVIAEAPNIGGRTAWLCKCDCGNEIQIITKSLRNGNTKSCGCLQKEKARENGGFKDLKNQKFGRLTVIELSPEKKGESRAYWKCLCECGNITIVSGKDLQSGHIQSCGCLRLEKLREAVAKDITGLSHKEYIKRIKKIFTKT